MVTVSLLSSYFCDKGQDNNTNTVHKARILCFPLCHSRQILSSADNRSGQQANNHGDRPIMLVSISMCVFSKILKYRTLYSKSKMSLKERNCLRTTSICLLFCLLCNGEIITRESNCVHIVLQSLK